MSGSEMSINRQGTTMNLRHWPLGLRLSAGFAVLLVLMLVMLVTGVAQLGRSDLATQRMAQAERGRTLADQWQSLTVLNHNRTSAIEVSGKNPDVIRRFEAPMKEVNDQISQVQQDIVPVFIEPEGKALLATVGERRQQAITAKKALLSAAAAGGATDKESEALAQSFTAYIQSLADLSTYSKRVAEEAAAEVKHAAQTGTWLLYGCGLASLLLGSLFAWIITRSVASPVTQAVQITEAIAAGDLSQPIEVDRGDELGRLLESLRTMQTSLCATVGSVRTAVDSITTASGEIATGNQDLSARTEQTAANLQETATSMEQLSETVRLNAESARNANQLASSASGAAQRGGSVVSEVVTTMSEISTSSRKIADIIGVIDGIAFQTNILALNAAVEAARAGEQGRGFAVVAGEVRSLAQRSANAAKEIKSLITSSVERVDAGSRLVEDAGATMREIVASVQRVSGIINEITSAASEQSDGIGQVNQAVGQLDQMTQQNAALVEQSAAAAQSLKDQAVRLSKVVGVFRTER
jgi:methyl-accepting chemotaxis protein